ncbi:hypothetical protein FRB95_012498 [Tulasnella sp. JGI-2019a]|nr:hypothetical protein FRB95_012498 [Tulasnella sp. JGI-2019a]
MMCIKRWRSIMRSNLRRQTLPSPIPLTAVHIAKITFIPHTFMSKSETNNKPAAIEVPKEFRMTSPGDYIIRSSDGVDYKVFQNILSLASPVFRSMFNPPQTPNATSRESDTVDLPVISVSEPSSVLSTMLLLIYPCGFFSFPNLDLVVDITKAYDKYNIDTRNLQLYLHEVLVSDKLLLENALGAYTAAWKLGMEEEARNASRYLHTLNLHGKAVKDGFISWIESGGLDALSALWDLRIRRGEALDKLVDAAYALSACPSHRPSITQASLRNKARAALNTPHPSCLDLRSFLSLRSLSPTGDCDDCKAHFSSGRTEVLLRRDMALISSFPQTIIWKPA